MDGDSHKFETNTCRMCTDFYYDENLCIGEYGIPFMPSLPGLDQTQSQVKTSQTSQHLEADMSS